MNWYFKASIQLEMYLNRNQRGATCLHFMTHVLCTSYSGLVEVATEYSLDMRDTLKLSSTRSTYSLLASLVPKECILAKIRMFD